ncbi:MAG: type II secretion system protein [Candidatus Riflebacteria bacterium]|nr:type II secretion system protein [Candidatus Riflebacteria bacterium]
MTDRRGFTLIELLVVIGVIATLAVLGNGYYQDYVEQARMAVVRNNLKTVREALANHFKDRLSYPTSLQSLVGPFLRETPGQLLVAPWGGTPNVALYVVVPKCGPAGNPTAAFAEDYPAGGAVEGWADANAFLATQTIAIPDAPSNPARQIRDVQIWRDGKDLGW